MSTGRGTSNRARQLTQRGRALLEARIRGEHSAGSSRVSIPRDDGADPAPLSLMQERIWIFQQLNPASAAYHIVADVALSGDLDVEVLEAAFFELVKRHEALRTTISLVDGEPMQVAGRPSPPAISAVDLMHCEDKDRELLKQVGEHASRMFDLSAGPLWRYVLFRLEHAEHVLLIVAHHIVCDGWSINLLLTELGIAYNAIAASEPPALAPLTLRYSDYARWERERVGGASFESELAYWKKELHGASAGLEFPVDRLPAGSAAPQTGRTSFWLDSGSRNSLSNLGRENGATLFDVLLAAFGVLLQNYTGREDFVVASPVSNRDRAETQDIVGVFLSMLLLRIRPSSELTFRELLGEVHRTTVRAHSNQGAPLELLEQLLIPGGKNQRPRQIRVMLNLNNTPARAVQVTGLTVKRKLLPVASFPFDLTVLVQTNVRENGATVVTFKYATSLFSASTIERLADHFRLLLSAVVADPDARLSELSLLSQSERHRLLVEWNDTAADFRKDKCLHELFEEQAAKTPEAVALVFGGGMLSYRELERRSNRLAHHLRECGVGPDVIVGLCVARSFDLIVALLAILKAGGAYLPLDPAYPADRLKHMVLDSGTRLLVTNGEEVVASLSDTVRALRLDAEASKTACFPDSSPRGVDVTPQNLAYVLYTSGSTGTPKGVMGTHQAVVNRLHWDVVDPSGPEVYVQKTTANFIDMLWEVFMPLMRGQRVVIADEALSKDPRGLVQLLSDAQVSRIALVPSLMRALLETRGDLQSRLPHLRYWASSGEALSAELADLLHARLPSAQLYNVYGTSEFWDASCAAVVWGDDGPCVTIGRPISNMLAYVLDGGLRPAPVGLSGELYIGGPGLARGYLGRPDLTAERFVPSPFGTGERLYRTGDLARWRADGELEYLGRLDHQVKIRGFRVEPGEIEARLLQHPELRQAVVVARDDGSGDKQLVAYVVASDGSIVGARDLRKHLQRGLPDYMIPSAYVALHALPLTPNGKIDRSALPAPESAAMARDSYMRPRTATEEALALMFAEVLKLERVGIDDNFFDLGGHSLLATRLMARLREAFRIELPLRAIFEAPNVRELAVRVETAQRRGVGLAAPALVRRPRPGALPLSHAQERLWLLEQIGGLGSAYNLPASVRLRGELDIAALQRSLAAVVERHEGLRTRFAGVEGTPVQVIDPPSQFRLEVEDLSALPGSEREAAARQRLGTLAGAPFDLERGPLLRAHLLRLSADEHIAVVSMHHIVSDGWSIGVLIHEVGALYAAFAAGDASPLPKLAVQYADYALWQRGWLRGEVLEKQIAYWKERLSGAPAALDLPADRPRPAVQSYRGGHYGFVLPAELAAGLNALAHSEGATPFMVLLTAFKVLLSRWSGQRDIVVGTPIAGRTHGELDGLIGLFVNTLALRTDVSGDPSFRELLQQVKDTALGAYAHQDLPFEKLVAELQPARDLGRQPIFQVLFALQNLPQETLQLPKLELIRIGCDNPTAKLDLSLYLHQRGDGLEGFFEYATDLFEASTIERLAGHLRVLLEAAVALPDMPIGELPLLTETERHRLLIEWNDTAADYPKEKCLHELFGEQAAKTPDAVALVYEGSELSYGKLEQRSNQLAHHLRGLGVGPEMIVGLCVERSLEMVVGLLGILKAGAAYLPLDPSYPAERLAYMLADTRAPVLVTQTKLVDRLPTIGAAVVQIDRDWRIIGRAPTTAPGNKTAPQNLAYVIYTSGSTGKPKGVMGTHGLLVNRLHWDAADPSGEQIYVQKTTPNFIDMLWEVFMPLIRGQCAAIAGEDSSRDLHRLIELLGTSRASRIVLVPSLLQALLGSESDLRRCLPDLRYWACSGEALSPELVSLFYDRLPDAQLFNVYGTSEFWDASWSVADRDAVHHGVSIGRPIPNAQIYVLDQNHHPAPIGVSGELYIGGNGLARGYFARPGLTAERFVPSPYREGERLYRTGDLARWRADGELEYLGRTDHQLKLRGFRIELGEIEKRLREHSAVGQAVVVAREDAPGDKRLVAYVVLAGEAGIDASGLRLHLKRSLPDYMVPSTFVIRDALPLMPNGKIDRNALPAPNDDAIVRGEYVAPRTQAEEVLAGIWAEVLKLDRVGVNDNFFESGGHSLLAMRAIARMRDAFQIELPVRALFEAPSVAEIAVRVRAAQREGLKLAAPALSAQPRPEVLPLSYGQERLWLLEQIGSVGSAYNIPASVRLRGTLDVAALERSFASVVERHEALRTRFAFVSGSPIQVIDPAGGFALQLEDLSALPEGERAAAVRARMHVLTQRPFDLERGPLFRAHLLRLSANEHIAIVTMHHIVSDGWSIGILIREVAALYAAFATGRTSPLSALPVQYADYALWQRGWLQGEVLEQQVAYWKQRLSGAPAALELPADRPRPAVQSYRGGEFTIELPAELTASLSELARAEGATLFMVLLAAFNLVLSRWSGQDDIVVGTPIAGRTNRAIEGLIGFFVNMLALRTDVSGNGSFRDLLGRVKEIALGAYAHQDLPFDKLVAELRPGRDLSRQPVFQVLFALQNVPQETLQLPGLQLSRIGGGGLTSKFDLSLYLIETGGGLQAHFEYATDLFDRATIERLASQYRFLLEHIAADTNRSCSQLARLVPAPGIEVTISSTFTGDVLVDPLRFWCERVGLTARIRTTGYNQVLQTLLSDQAAGYETNHFHLILLRLEDWGRRPAEAEAADDAKTNINFGDIERNVDDFVDQLRIASGRGKGHHLIGLCPASVPTATTARNVLRLQLIERRLTGAVSNLPRVFMLPLADTMNALRVAEVHDQYLGKIADIPYTPQFLVAAATSALRAMFQAGRHPHRVVVADCDNTLWRGVCGEDGALGVAVTPGCRLLQDFLVRQAHNGVLICLCSRNNEADVIEVFRSNKEMLLSWQDILAHRIGCATKSTSIAELAVELDLALDSFLFLDDDAVECARMAEACPDVLTLRIPQDDGEMDGFLSRLWAFDGAKATDEDRQRSQRYRQERLRRDPQPSIVSDVDEPGLDFRVARRRFYELIALEYCSAADIERDMGAMAPRKRIAHADYIATRTPVEEVLAAIWAEVLKLDRVGVHDNFFELGGHSLLATRAMARIRDAFRIELPLGAVFEASTVGELAGRIEAALREGVELAVPGLAAVRRPEVLPLSYAQERLWLLEQIGGLGSAYNLPAAVRLRGALDVAALQRSLATVVERHEGLRTRFGSMEDSPVQVIDPAGSFGLAIEDLSTLPEGERAAAARERIHALAQQPFDLKRGPLFRANLLRLSDDEHIAVVAMHHLVSDGWSIGVLIREVGALYAAFSQGRGSPLPELPVQYADYALWQRDWLRGEVLARQVGYWTDHLNGAPAALELPTDRGRPAVQSYRGEGFTVELPAELTTSLHSLARSEGATLFMVLLAAFKVVLSRWSGQRDIVVGSPIAGRTYRELEGLIGFFVNALALRTDLSGDPNFRELLGRVKKTALGGYAHQDLPFEKLVAELRPLRDLSRQPIFQVLFALQNVPQETLQLPGMELSRIGGGRPTAKFDLSLYVHEQAGTLEGYFEYATDLFERSTIEHLAGHWMALLEAAAARPGVPLSELSMVGAAERSGRQTRALDRASLGSDEAVLIAQAPSLTDCFVAEVGRRPEATAIVAGEQCWSYGKLKHEAGRIAALLMNERGPSNEPVALLFSHTPIMVAAILGVLGAGKFYVPLSPGDPPARLRAIVAESRCGCVLVDPELRELGEQLGAAVLSADQAPDESAELLSRPSTAVAYILYTSGTTGTPKGVAQCDRSILQHIAAYSGTLGLDRTDRMALLAGYGADAAVKNIFGSLLSGASLCLWDVRRKGLEGLEAWLVANAITIWHSTPSLLRAALPQFAAKAHLRWVVTGGEPAAAEDLAIVQRHAGEDCRLLAGYSQTECSTALQYAPDFERDLRRHRLPAGRPVPGATVVLLDEAGRPADIRGEIAIGGGGVALGYWRRPGLTAERFLPSPYGEGERLYRTGDQARWRADGTLDYLGRIDHQVKIRGYRIEPGEVEAALVEHPDVHQAVVVAREDVARERHLVAYVVASDKATVDAIQLRTHLKRSLPEYMVPSAFVLLEALPLTPNRKVDRNSLPAPEQEAGVRGEHAAPRNSTEELLASIWSELLERDRVSVHDNFFELGGHSLLAMRLMARLRDAFAIELPLRALFEAATVAELAGRIEVAQREGSGLAVPPLAAVQRPEALPLSYAQERLWLLDQIEDLGSAYIMPAAVRLQGVLDVAALEHSFAAVVERHEGLRTRFAVLNGHPLQVIDAPGQFVLQLEDLSEVMDGELAAAARERMRVLVQQPFDLERGPLFRAHLLRLRAEEHIAVVVMHHIVSDGWSTGVLIREVGALYAAFSQGRASPLAALAVQYADYAIWQRGWLQGEALEKQVAYWRDHLSGAPAALELPTDRARPAVQSYRGAYHRFALPADLTRGLNELARSGGVTLYMVLLAGFQLLLKRYSGQHDIVVGSPIAGRTHREVEGLIGFFVNTLVVRTELSGELSFEQLLKRVKEAALGAYAHQDLPFEKLVEELRPTRDLSRQPIFQVLFTLQNVPQERFDLPTLTLSRVEGDAPTSKFDLSLYMHETPNGLWGYFEYATDLFDGSTIARAADHYRALLEQIVADPLQSCAQLESAIPALGIDVTVSSTFTADALVDSLRFWCERTGLTAHITTTGYNQVLQSLLADQSNPLGPNRFHVVLLRLGDWGRRASSGEDDDTEANVSLGDLERNVEDFIEQLGVVSGSGAGYYLIGLCPEPAEASTTPGNALRLDLIRRRLLESLRDFPQVAVLPLEQTLDALGVSGIHDTYLDRIAGIPYTPAFFVAAAASAMRALFEVRRHPYKVIVADCDNTLWRGICGEDGPQGVTVTPECRLLQEFLIRQAHNGVLLCLCSRNNEADVVEVFRSNKDMLLSWDDIVSHRIGWGAKSSAIAELAAELDLAPDSFVFLDDDAVECARVQQDCPEVLTFNVPQGDGEMRGLLDRLWSFDGAQPTAEDRKRSQRYRQERRRREVRHTSASLQNFIAGLELKVELRPIAEEDADRVVQMMERTTQFNTTGLRLTTGQVRQCVASSDKLCLIAEVSDRFGDYGKSALLLVDRMVPRWTVACLALSCRVLGREVEHRILELLNAHARTAGVSEITFRFEQTARNVPAQRFLQELRKLAELPQQGDAPFTFSPDQIAAALQRRQTTDRQPEIASDVQSSGRIDLSLPAAAGELDFRAARRQFYRLIAIERRSMSEIGRDLGSLDARQRNAAVRREYDAPRTPVEEMLASIWAEVLKLDRVGVHDNFFELGGHSLLATRVAAMTYDRLNVDVPLRALFSQPTIKGISEIVEFALSSEPDGDNP